MATITRALFRLDTLGFAPVVIKVEPHADPMQVQTVVWSLDTARAIQADKERLAATYEREADEADREGRTDAAAIQRAMASDLLTEAHDLFVVLQGAEQRVAA